MFYKYVSSVVWICVVLWLAACTNDGNDVDPNIVMGAPSQTTFTVSASTSDTTAPVIDQITIPYNGPENFVHVSASDETALLGAVGYVTANGIILDVTLLEPNMLAAGVYPIQITVSSCPGGDCSIGHHEGSPKHIDITYTVTPGSIPSPGAVITTDPNAINLSTIEGLAAADTTININTHNQMLNWSVTIKYLQGQGWISLDKNAGSNNGPLTLSFQKLPAGSYTANIEINHVVNGNIQMTPVPVNLSVTKALVSNANPVFNVNQSTTSGMLTSSFIITNRLLGNTAVNGVNWSASSDVAWLSAPTAGGTIDTLSDFSVQVLAAEMEKLSNGNYNGTITISTTDPTITSISIPVTLNRNVNPLFTLAPTTLTYDINEASSVANLSHTVLVRSNLSDIFSALQWSVNAKPTWLSSNVTSGDTVTNNALILTLDTAALLAMNNGSLSGDVIIASVGGGVPNITLPVTLNLSVNKALSVQNQTPTINVDIQSVAADLNGSTIVSSNLGEVFAETLSWSAASSAAWLVMDTVSGDTATGNTAGWHIDQTELAGLANGSYTATIDFTSSTGVAPAQAQVTLNVNFPKLDLVTPFSSSTNLSREIVLHGSGFNSITSQTVLFGGQASGNALKKVSDSEIRITHPVYTSAQSLAINIENGLNLPRDNVAFEIVAQPTVSTVELTTATGDKSSLYYHPVRKALMYGDITHSEIVVFEFNGSSWTKSTQAVTGLRDIAISSDGNEVLALTDTVVTHYDAYTLALVKSSDIAVAANLIGGTFPSGTYLNGIEMTNDGNMLLSARNSGGGATPMYLYYSASGGFYGFGNVSNTILAGAGNGSLVVVGSTASPAEVIRYYYTSDLKLYESLQSMTVTSVATNLLGNRMAFNNTIYDGTLNDWGTIAEAIAGFSPDGKQTYGFDQTNNNVVIYDSSISAGGGPLSSVGTLSLGTANIGTPSQIISRDDGTVLFVAGANSIVVLSM